MKKYRIRLALIFISVMLLFISLLLFIANYSDKLLLPIVFLLFAFILDTIFGYFSVKSKKNYCVLEEHYKKNNNYELLYELFAEISSSDNIRQIYDKLLRYAIKAVPHASFGSVLVNDGTNHFYFTAMTGNILEKFKDFKFSVDELSLDTKTTGNSYKAVIVENILDGNKFRFKTTSKLNAFNQAAINDIRYTMSVPIYIDNELKVVINLDTNKSRIFSEEEKKYLEVFASAATPFIKLDEALSNLEFLGTHDKLTGLHNRGYFDKIFDKKIDKLKQYKIISIDIDHFKQINDLYGHSIGDECLVIFAKLLKINFPSCITTRYGGDEFLILCEIGEECDIIKKFEIIDKNCYIILKNGKSKKFNFSYGIASSRGDSIFNELYKAADKKMYIQKRSKQNK